MKSICRFLAVTVTILGLTSMALALDKPIQKPLTFDVLITFLKGLTQTPKLPSQGDWDYRMLNGTDFARGDEKGTACGVIISSSSSNLQIDLFTGPNGYQMGGEAPAQFKFSKTPTSKNVTLASTFKMQHLGGTDVLEVRTQTTNVVDIGGQQGKYTFPSYIKLEATTGGKLISIDIIEKGNYFRSHSCFLNYQK